MGITPQTNCRLEDIAKQFMLHDHFVICGHVSPDGDCLGSQLALMHALRAHGKTVTCLFAQDARVDRGLLFLPGIEEIVPAEQFDGTCEVFVTVDVQIGKRIGNANALVDQAACRISIDHHAVDECVADFNYVDPDAAATCMLIWELAGMLGVADLQPIATCCYTGLVTDTGSFQFANADSACFSVASSMVDKGVQPQKIAAQVFQSRRAESLFLERVAIDHMEIDETTGLVMSTLRAEDFADTGAHPDDAETFVDLLRSLECARVVCLMREQDGTVRGSLRAKDETDVSAIARIFGGGGHVPAAGFTIEDATIEDVYEKVRATILDRLRAE